MYRSIKTRNALLFSVIIHGLTFAWLVFAFTPVVRIRVAKAAKKNIMFVAYGPESASSARVHVAHPVHHRQANHAPTLKAVAAIAQPQNEPTPGVGVPGENSLGSGDIAIALTHYFPEPKPDLSSLPSGTAGDVIIDVLIDAQGRIAEAKLVRGIGGSIDHTVMATVQTWTFVPATKDGVAIASRQELLFHYEHA